MFSCHSIRRNMGAAHCLAFWGLFKDMKKEEATKISRTVEDFFHKEKLNREK